MTTNLLPSAETRATLLAEQLEHDGQLDAAVTVRDLLNRCLLLQQYRDYVVRGPFLPQPAPGYVA
jgi:hypothetical protein